MNKPAPKPSITAQQVRDYLKSHPDFLKKNADMFESLQPPERAMGDGIVDFQQYMVKNLQKGSKDLQGKYDLLVDFCRENMSVQQQVHQAALKLIRASNLEQLLEVVTQDLVSLFDVDVVRLAMESDILFDTSYGDQIYSGIVFIDPGSVDETLGKKKAVHLAGDCENDPPFAFEQIFADCAGLIASCALLRLDMETVDKHIILAFGVRHKDRFHPGQGIELLGFLAQIVAHQLDRYLSDLAL